MAKKLTQSKVEETNTVTQTFEWTDGDEVEIDVEKATLDEIEGLEEKELNDEFDTDSEMLQHIVDEYVEQDLNAKDFAPDQVELVFKNILKAWGVEESDLDEFIEERQGN